MDSIDAFIAELVDHGIIAFDVLRLSKAMMTQRVTTLLTEAFETHRLSVTGPRIAFDVEIAFRAAELVRQAAWAVVNREDRADQLAKRMVVRRYPVSASEHLSADLMLRYLPGILVRARGIDFQDPLIELLVEILRRHPLTGALAELDEGPLAPLEFGGHRGLCLLYAERVARNDRTAWRPTSAGLALECYELATSVDRSQGRLSEHRK